MADVFVSYSPEDATIAQAIVDAVSQAGRDVFRAHSPADGKSIADQVREQFQAARCVICLWSWQAARSRFMQEEIQHAIRAWSEGRLVLATLDDTPLPVGLRDLTGIPVRMGPTGVDTTCLLDEVKQILDPVVPAQAHIDDTAPIAGKVIARAAIPEAASSTGAAASARRHGAMPLVLVLTLLVAAGMALSWISGDFEARRYAGGMGKGGGGGGMAKPSAPTPDVAKPLPTPPPKPPTQTVEIPPPGQSTGPGIAPPAPTEPPIASGTPPGSGSGSDPSSGVPIFVVMLLGIAIGAVTVWAWSKWSRTTTGTARPIPTATPQSSFAAEQVHQVFVSYSRQDGRAVDDLVKAIEQAGYAVWIDRHSTGSQRYAAPIVRAIKTSRLVALMCSENAFTSDHVIREVYVAGDYKKPFIAFQLDRSEFPDDVLYFVSGFPRVEIEQLDIQQLRSELARLVAA